MRQPRVHVSVYGDAATAGKKSLEHTFMTQANVKSTTTPVALDKSGERVRKMFGEIAPRYDLMNRVLSMNVDVYWRWRTTRIVRPDASGPILDCCSGTGDLAFSWERATDFQVSVVAADFTPEMLEIGREKLRKRPRSRVEFLQADTEALPFEDNRFQIVSAAFGLRNVSNTDQGLREMTRVCRPGGKVVILEFSMPRRQPVRGIYQWYFRNVLPRVGQAFASNTSDAYNYLPESVGDFPSYEKLTERMTAAGLSQARYYPLTFGIATLYVGVK